ncbi:MAG: hypothetical protein Q7S22_03660 [Candidatus Micrarchaeota archaeon]|nr:hypothetical protein [Candidatus Micrarchaeota archaeon]
MHKNPEHSDFMKTIEDIRVSENESEKIKLEAKEKADLIMRNAKENVMKMKSDIEEELVQRKNTLIHQGKEKIEKEVQENLGSAKKVADGLKNKALSQKDISAAASIIFNI